MKIKFIKDLDENEMADFKKSSLHKIINNNWIPTHSHINYYYNYYKAQYVDYSVVVFQKSNFFLAMLSYSKENILSFFEEPVNIYSLDDKSANLNLAYNLLYKKILSFKQDFNFLSIRFFENSKILSHFFDNICSVSSNYEMYVDLSQKEEIIKMNVRKSFKSLINWGDKNLKTEIINSDNLIKSKFDNFKNFHERVSEKKTRSDESWELQFEAIKSNESFLNLGYLDDELVAGVLIVHGFETAYYGVAVNDRKLMSKNLPIGHAVLYNSILHAKQIGLSKFILGNLNYTDCKKSNAIMKFKKGFTNTINSYSKYLIEL